MTNYVKVNGVYKPGVLHSKRAYDGLSSTNINLFNDANLTHIENSNSFSDKNDNLYFLGTYNGVDGIVKRNENGVMSIVQPLVIGNKQMVVNNAGTIAIIYTSTSGTYNKINLITGVVTSHVAGVPLKNLVVINDVIFGMTVDSLLGGTTVYSIDWENWVNATDLINSFYPNIIYHNGWYYSFVRRPIANAADPEIDHWYKFQLGVDTRVPIENISLATNTRYGSEVERVYYDPQRQYFITVRYNGYREYYNVNDGVWSNLSTSGGFTYSPLKTNSSISWLNWGGDKIEAFDETNNLITDIIPVGSSIAPPKGEFGDLIYLNDSFNFGTKQIVNNKTLSYETPDAKYIKINGTYHEF